MASDPDDHIASSSNTICGQLLGKALNLANASTSTESYENHMIELGELFANTFSNPEKLYAIAAELKDPDNVSSVVAKVMKVGSDLASVHKLSPKGQFLDSTKAAAGSLDSINSWQMGKQLGNGSYGKVYEAYTDNNFIFAVKVNSDKNTLAVHKKELEILIEYQHENIVRYLGTDTDEHHIYIFLEKMTGGSIKDLFTNTKYDLVESNISNYTRQILTGLKYLHENDVVHRDIKCSNILVDANGTAKLADFGLAKEIKPNVMNSTKGAQFWMAPEVRKDVENGYRFPSDIWSIACTVIEMFTKKPPYHGLDDMEKSNLISNGHAPPVPAFLSESAQDFLSQCLQIKPEDRPTVAELLKHRFVTQSQQEN